MGQKNGLEAASGNVEESSGVAGLGTVIQDQMCRQICVNKIKEQNYNTGA
jgi:hypothetical protein